LASGERLSLGKCSIANVCNVAVLDNLGGAVPVPRLGEETLFDEMHDGFEGLI
jgi:hypothetical protein